MISEEKKEKILEYLMEGVQDMFNIGLIVLLWPDYRFWAIMVIIYEMLRISAYFSLGDKAKGKAIELQTDAMVGRYKK